VGAIEKMSKSRNNGVDPQSLVDRYGADTVRLFSMFAAPPDQSLEWSDSGVEGAFRFLRRLWTLVSTHVDSSPAAGETPILDPAALNEEQREIRRLVHETIAKVTDDYDRRFAFNTAIAALMELTNNLARFEDDSAQGRAVAGEGWTAIVQLLAPVTPHLSEALWEVLGHEEPLLDAGWPEPDESARVKTSVEIAVQVNGKLRGRIEVDPGCSQEPALAQALSEPNVQRHIDGKTIRKVIHVPDRLLNIVVG
jgi:leucyl-tRNA synthetase